MENRYRIEDEFAILEVPYKGNMVEIQIDKEDIGKVSSISGRWILLKKTPAIFYIVCNQDKTISLHKLLVGATKEDSVYFKEKTYTNLSKSNLMINTYETDEAFRQKRKEAYQNMSAQGKVNLLRGIRDNRYSKEWSTKLSDKKKGKQNASSKLNEKIVRRIREEYSLHQVTQQTLAEYYKVGRTTIGDIVNYRTWAEIGEDPKKNYRIYVENQIIDLDLRETPIQEYLFTNKDILQQDVVLHVTATHSEEYIFIQKIGKIKLYVEVRDKNKGFVHSFEIVFPEFLTPMNIHNYVITHRKPTRYMHRHDIHYYMCIISTFLFGQSVAQEKTLEKSGSLCTP
ncbi:hypothetical protein PP175_25895 (plasmid) [Aneurinibacillus sp. Ricciae_BoGa-3]|uniref:hypothetical protein n=1 Tax=Aneurinibacillus sp. Ricciae_BoGa-3 TaxID=3022697 RepID=UPI00233FC78A|nr:hypothetical protein [Aneurinibacillus sp. Ricciae_BoGa-3]WCK57502.1 hypothetical protein PP175_25895 [Aneurinibacillus sp. Ricciae_BoGa-3]